MGQVGKIGEDLFNVDLRGCLSPFQAFAAALAVFDHSSHMPKLADKLVRRKRATYPPNE